MPSTTPVLLRRIGRFVLMVAMTATVTAVVQSVPQAANAADPEVLLTSPPTSNGSAHPPLTVTTLGGTTTITNPGSTFGTTGTCMVPAAPAKPLCLGMSDDGETTPTKIEGFAGKPQGLPGATMNFLIDEGVTAVAAQHGVLADDRVRNYARPDIRAYVFGRLQNILNKKLYGETLTPEESSVYDAIEAIYKQRQVDSATWALEEYNLWSANPCAYVAPTPPANSGLPAVPNEARTSTDCNQPNSPSKLFKFSNNTPPASTFDTWASYRHPTPSMVNGSSASFKQMTTATISAVVTAAGTAAALVGGAIGGPVGVAIATSMAASIAATSSALGSATASTSSVLAGWFGAAAGATVGAFAGAVVSILLGIVIGAVAIYQLVEDAKPGQQLNERARNAAAQTDALGIKNRIADYAGLPMYTDASKTAFSEPAGKPRAAIHEFEFTQQLLSQSNEWQMFSAAGNLIPDPTAVPAGAAAEYAPTPNDYKFKDGAAVQDYIQLSATGTVGRKGTAIAGYRVKINRGWLMVSEITTSGSTIVEGPYEPRLSVPYVAPDGTKGLLSLLRTGKPDEAPKVYFQLTKPDAESSKVNGSGVESFSFKNTANTSRTVTLQTVTPSLPSINVIPSVEGDLGADHNVTLQANASTPAQGGNGVYTWTIERLATNGTVAETIDAPAPNLAGFQMRFETAGRYRARVNYAGTTPVTFNTSGRVEFTIRAPEPEVLKAEVIDKRALNGALFLDLNLLQNTRTDTYTVKVDWATDGDGAPVSETYTVQCVDTGLDTCSTGTLELPETAPTNPRWSKSPTFAIAPDQNYLPFVNVTVTNTYGQVIKRAFPITPGDQRPKYADDTPSVAMAAGTDSTVNVTEVFPATILPPGASDQLSIQLYYGQILDQLPPGLSPDLSQIAGKWYLQIKGTPTADSIGNHSLFFPFEQEPAGSGLRPPPATVNLEIKASVDPGYRAILRGVPTEPGDRKYRNVYPDYRVQVAQVLSPGQTSFTPFTGTVKCKLVSGPNTVFDKPCAQDKPFPWPTERITDANLIASVYVQSASQPISADGPYTAGLATRFLNVEVSTTTPAANAMKQTFTMKLDDNGYILAPYNGYTVTCSIDKAAYKPCFGNGSLTLDRVPGAHTIDVKAVGPAGSVIVPSTSTVQRYTWTVAPQARALGFKVPVTKIKRGKSMTLKGSLLLPQEKYTIKIGSKVVGTGKATTAGIFTKAVKVPAGLKPGRYKVTLTGASGKRIATRWLVVTK